MKGTKFGERVGLTLGRLTVIEEIDSTFVLTMCSCGNLKKVRINNLLRGGTKSCGCLFKDSVVKHGMWGTPTYVSWSKMKDRCNAVDGTYHDYYGHVSYCEDWEFFDNFLRDMGTRPDGCSLDRIDPRGNYTPENCRWVPTAQQNRNTRKRKNNTSGVTGVSLYKHYWQAQWIGIDGKPRLKSFSILMHGDEEAFRLACATRRNAIDELNAEGAAYGETHGE